MKNTNVASPRLSAQRNTQNTGHAKMLALLKCGNTVHNNDTHFHHGKIAFLIALA
jgi:hypothetical protein